jgi:chemotaxis signal transduction protein
VGSDRFKVFLIPHPMFKNQEVSVQIAKNYWYEPTIKVEPTIEFMTWEIGEIGFGISIDKVQQIISSSKVNTAPNPQLLDLHDRLFGISAPDSAYSLLVNSRDDGLYSISVDTAPTLMTIGIDRIRQIPNNYATINILEIASHVAKIDDPDSIVFILDI